MTRKDIEANIKEFAVESFNSKGLELSSFAFWTIFHPEPEYCCEIQTQMFSRDHALTFKGMSVEELKEAITDLRPKNISPL